VGILEIQGWVQIGVGLALLAVTIFAFVSALSFSAESYEAAGKLTKTSWLLILGLATVVQLLGVGALLLTVIFTVAALVFLVDVRPALAGLRR
jgi:hypothetical protein